MFFRVNFFVAMGLNYSRNWNYQNEPATPQGGADPEIFKKYEDSDRPVRGELGWLIKKYQTFSNFRQRFFLCYGKVGQFRLWAWTTLH